jgi:hypothetical protein
MERFIELILVFISGENCICFNHTLKVRQIVRKVKLFPDLDEGESVSLLVLIKGDTLLTQRGG